MRTWGRWRTFAGWGILVLSLVGGAVTFPAFAADPRGSARKDSPSNRVATQPVRRGALVVTILEQGELRASKAQTMSAPFTGKITRLLPEGTSVQPKDPVVWMETTDLEELIETQQAEFDRVQAVFDKALATSKLVAIQDDLDGQARQAELEYAKVKIEDAQRQVSKMKTLVENKLAPRSDMEDAQLRVNAAELALKTAEIALERSQSNKASNEKIQAAEMRRAQVDLDKAKRDVEQSRDDLARATMVTEQPGMIVHCKAWRGSGFGKMQEGDQVYRGQGILELPDFTEIEVILFVNEMDIFQVHEGQEVTVDLEALPDRTFKGTIGQIAALAQDMGQSKDLFGDRSGEGEGISAFEVRIALSEKDDRMRQGMTARVAVQVARSDSALIIPAEALFYDDRENPFAWVKRDGAPVKAPVKVGLANEDEVEILDGLGEGDEVFLSDPVRAGASKAEAKRPGEGGP